MQRHTLRFMLGVALIATLFAGAVYAVVNPVTPPDPPHNNFNRATYVWGTTDELGTDQKQQTLLNFCRDRGVNVVFLDIWRYLGGGNYTTTNRNLVMKFVDAAHKSGIRVYALAGNVDWGTNHSWVMENIIQRLARYQAEYNTSYPAADFDGVLYDVEYWTDEVNYPASTNLPGLCDLVRATRRNLDDLPVGVFAGFFLKDSTSTRPTVNYNGKLAQDGEHLMDACDFVVVGTYRDTAVDNAGNGQPGQITLFQPWYDYAKQDGKSVSLYAGSETINISPSYITYYGETKTAMEAEHSTLTNAFRVTTDSVFMGVAVHDYIGWKAMAN